MPIWTQSPAPNSAGRGADRKKKNRSIQKSLTRNRGDLGPSVRSGEERVSGEWKRLEALQRTTPVLPTQRELDTLASRIEAAYRLRQPHWQSGCSTARVWFAAAHRLWQTHQVDPLRVPLDPELFVASQPVTSRLADPWSDLTQPEAGSRYRRQVRHIVRLLKAELRREVRRAERSIRARNGVKSVVALKKQGVSPLGMYIVARRGGFSDLAQSFLSAAVLQHRSCPLYRAATLAFLPADCYPADEIEVESQCEIGLRPANSSISAHEKYKVFEN